jgi:hypothetical protein
VKAPPEVASDDTLNALWAAVPQGRFVGHAGIVRHEQVEFIGKLVDDSGIATLIDGWQASDAVGSAPGGATRLVCTRTNLILFLITTVEHNAQLIEELAVLVSERLTAESLAYLGLDTELARWSWSKPRRQKGEPKSAPLPKRVRRRRTKELWYFPLWRSLQRTLAPMDYRPKPPALKDGKGNRGRGKFPTLDEVQALRESWNSEHLQERRKRLESAVHELIEATLRLQPVALHEEWAGDICVDASVVPAYGKRGAPWGGTHGAIDPSASWYMRTSQWETTSDAKKAKKAVFGWDLTLLLATNHEPDELKRHSGMIVGMSLDVPATGLIPAAADAFERVAEHGHPVGRATGDRGYAAGAKPEHYQLRLKRLGYEIVTDYKNDQLGLDNDGGYAGAIQVEGSFFCPVMPEELINATKKVRSGGITNGDWRKLIDRREKYLVRPKEKPDAYGRTPMMCPAKGPGATVSCPVAELHGGKPNDSDTVIYEPPTPDKQDLICTNISSVSFPERAGAKLAQGPRFGTRDWQTKYTSDRGAIEGGNAYMKDHARENLEAAGRRRIRGVAAQTLLIGFLVVSANLRKLQKMRDDWERFDTDEQREAHREAKQRYRQARRKNEKRVAPWDNFQSRNAAEDLEAPSPATEPDPPPRDDAAEF